MDYLTNAVELWLMNDEPTHKEVLVILREVRDSVPDEAPMYMYTDAMKEYIEDNMPDLGCTMYADLLMHAVQELDYVMLVDSFADYL